MGVGVTLGNGVLSYALKGSIPTWVSLHTAEPDPDTSTLNEVTGAAYARQQVAATDWNTPAASASDTAVVVTFPAAGASWGTVTHVGIYDAATAGNILLWGPIGVPRTIGPGDSITFPIGNLTATVG
jgi:hypothetical protein